MIKQLSTNTSLRGELLYNTPLNNVQLIQQPKKLILKYV